MFTIIKMCSGIFSEIRQDKKLEAELVKPASKFIVMF